MNRTFFLNGSGRLSAHPAKRVTVERGNRRVAVNGHDQVEFGKHAAQHVLNPGLTANRETIRVRSPDGHRPRAECKRDHHVGPAADAGIKNHRHGPGCVDDSGQAVQGWQAATPATPTTPGSASYLLTVTDPAQAAPAVTRALVAAGADVLSIAESRHTLEDVYLELVDDREDRPR